METMKTFKVTYIHNSDVLCRTFKEQTEVVQAKDYTKAYLKILFKLPRGSMVIDVTEIKDENKTED